MFDTVEMGTRPSFFTARSAADVASEEGRSHHLRRRVRDRKWAWFRIDVEGGTLINRIDDVRPDDPTPA
jgi:hypothetical protein